jgi:hypothetical protein
VKRQLEKGGDDGCKNLDAHRVQVRLQDEQVAALDRQLAAKCIVEDSWGRYERRSAENARISEDFHVKKCDQQEAARGRARARDREADRRPSSTGSSDSELVTTIDRISPPDSGRSPAPGSAIVLPGRNSGITDRKWNVVPRGDGTGGHKPAR